MTKNIFFLFTILVAPFSFHNFDNLHGAKIKGSKIPIYSKTKPITILFLGDSLTQGYLVDEENNYPNLVQKILNQKGYKVKIINGGLNGDTSAGGLNRYKWFIKTDFNILFLALGSNDGLRGISIPTIKKNLLEIIAKTKAKSKTTSKKINIVLAGLKLPPNYGKQYTKDFERIFLEIAKAEKTFFYPFLLEGVAGEVKLNQNDGIHPNEKGYEIIGEKIAFFLEKTFFQN